MKTTFRSLSLIPFLGIVFLFAHPVYFFFRYPSMSSWLRFNPEELNVNSGLILGLFYYGLLLNVICLIWFGIGRFFQIKYNFTCHNALVLVATLVLYVLVHSLDFPRQYRAWLLD